MIDTSLDSSNFYFLAAVIQGVLLSALIIFQYGIRKPHVYFSLLILLFSSALLHFILESSIAEFNRKFPYPMEFTMAYGPLAFLHIVHIKNPLRRFKIVDLLHFLPALLLEGLLFIIGFSYLNENPQWASNNTSLIITISMTLAFLGILHLAIYSYLIYQESKATRFILKGFIKVKQWLNYLLIAWAILIGFLVITIPTVLYFVEIIRNYTFLVFIPLGVIICLFIYGLGYTYLLKYGRSIKTYMDKVSKIKLTQEELEKRKELLLKCIKSERIYQDSSLSPAKLAGHLGWTINDLSIIINELMHTTFNDLINQHRVEAFKAKINSEEAQKFSILGLSQEVGFQSKASFYRIFKKETGITPTEYINKHT